MPVPQGGASRARGMSASTKGLVATVGIAFYWKYFRSTSLSTLLSAYAGRETSEPSLASFLYYLLVLVLSAAALAPGASGTRAGSRRGPAVALGLAASVCLWAPWARLALPARASLALESASLGLLACSFVLSTATWAQALARQPGAPGAPPLLVVALSMLLSLALFSVELLSDAISAVTRSAAPAASALCCATLADAHGPASAASAEGRGRWRPRGLDAALFITLACMLALAVLAREVSAPILRQASIENSQQVKNLITVMELALVALVGLFGAGRPSSMRFGWLALAAVFLAALLVVALSDGAGVADQVALLVLFSMPVCFEMYVLMLVVAGSSEGRADAGRLALAILLIPEAAAHAAGQACLLWLPAASADTLPESAPLIACVLGTGVAACVFCFASSLAFRKAGPPAQGPLPQAAPQAPLDSAVERLACGAGLTARERDMVSYLARGYSNKRIADECGISLNTVQTHVQNCYRKLGVHTRDDLARLLDDARQRL